MGEVAVTIVRWTVRLAIVISLVFAFIVLWNFAYSLLFVTVNQSVLGDIMAIVQIWLPFDLDVLLAWTFTASLLYLAYRLAMFTAGIVNKFVGES